MLKTRARVRCELPRKERGSRAVTREHSVRAQAVRKVRIAGQVAAGRSSGRGLHPGNEAETGDTATDEQVIQHIVPRLIDVGVNLMCGQVPGPRRDAYPDVPADLANPDRLPVKTNACAPQPQMQALRGRRMVSTSCSSPTATSIIKST